MKRAYFNWSSGKDSALALYRALNGGEFSIEVLFSVLKSEGQRIAMHETGIELLKKQADAIGIELMPFYFNSDWSGETYGAAMSESIARLKARNITTALFGDLHLEPLRAYREQRCHAAGIRADFPLWGISMHDTLSEFIRLGHKAILTCVDTASLPKAFVGRWIDESFLANLPEGVDVCGKNGEYHSSVFDGPIFRHPVDFKVKGAYSKTFAEGGGGDVRRYSYLNLV